MQSVFKTISFSPIHNGKLIIDIFFSNLIGSGWFPSLPPFLSLHHYITSIYMKESRLIGYIGGVDAAHL